MTPQESFGERIWNEIEAAQGSAYISDSINDMGDDEAREIVKNSLFWFKECVKILRKELANHELHHRATPTSV